MSGPEDLKLGGKYNAGNPAGRRVMTDKQDPPTSAEPVAWRVRGLDQDWVVRQDKPSNDWTDVQPLYAHPPTSVEPVAWVNYEPDGLTWYGKPLPPETDLYAHPPTSAPIQPNVRCPVCQTALGARWLTQDDVDPPTSAEPVAFVIGWHVETGTTALHPFVRLDIRYFPGQPKLKVGDKIYAHLPTSEWNDAIQDVLNLACSRRWDMEELVEAIRGLKR